MALENFVLRSGKVLTLGRIPGNRMKQMSLERVSSTVIATRTKRWLEKSVGARVTARFSSSSLDFVRGEPMDRKI